MAYTRKNYIKDKGPKNTTIFFPVKINTKNEFTIDWHVHSWGSLRFEHVEHRLLDRTSSANTSGEDLKGQKDQHLWRDCLMHHDRFWQTTSVLFSLFLSPVPLSSASGVLLKI